MWHLSSFFPPSSDEGVVFLQPNPPRIKSVQNIFPNLNHLWEIQKKNNEKPHALWSYRNTEHLAAVVALQFAAGAVRLDSKQRKRERNNQIEQHERARRGE
jgi:hypothetical protein